MTEEKITVIEKPIEKKEARGFLSGMIMLIPNFLKLLGRLFRDSRVPTTEKALLVGAIIYVISPLDLIPDFIPFVGEIDDLYLVSLVLLRLMARTDDNILREHWDGRGDISSVVDKIVRAAQYILPKRVQRILLGKVEIAPQIKGGLFSSPAAPEDIEDAREKQRRRS